MDFNEFSKLTFHELQRYSFQQLKGYYGDSEASSVVKVWLQDRMSWTFTQYVLSKDQKIGDRAKILFQDLQELLAQKPVQYVTGKCEFFGLQMLVNEHVLIPRSETEKIVELAISLQPKTVLDLCTGSGCIPIAISSHLPEAEVIGVDISKEALAVANQNNTLLKTKVKFLARSVFDLSENEFHEIDVITSNPPYIGEQEWAELLPHVRDYEPKIALTPGDDPLIFYHEIAQKSQRWLKEGGILLFEVHCNFANQVAEILKNLQYTGISIFQDSFGRDRVVFAGK